MIQKERAAEFLIKLLLKDHTGVTSFRYYEGQRIWEISSRKTPESKGTPYHRLRLPVTPERFEQLLELFGVTVAKTISNLDGDLGDFLFYGQQLIGFYKRFKLPDQYPGPGDYL